jgi:hypothetical protein
MTQSANRKTEMENGLTTTKPHEVTTSNKNVWESYGDVQSGRNNIVGKLLKFSKGEYLAGQDGDEVPEGTQLVAIMDSLMAGWVKWEDSKPAEHRMVQISNGDTPLRRKELGDTDEELWEVDDNGEKRDPWQFTNYLVMVSTDTKDVFTFTTSSRGGQGAIGELCKLYGKNIRQAPDDIPLIALEIDSYKHRDKKLGKIFVPKFEVHGWKPKAPWAAVVEGSVAAQATEERNEIPFDGAAKPAAPLEDIPAAFDLRPSKAKTRF